MIRPRRTSGSNLLLTTWFAFTALAALAQTPSTKPFLVFEAMDYFNKPDCSVYGIVPISLIYPDRFGPPNWYNHANGPLPDMASVQAVAREAQLKGYPVSLDIEHWELQGTTTTVQSSLTKYMTVLQWFQAAAPGLPVGYYGPPPIIDYGRALRTPSDPLYLSWMAENDQILPLANRVNLLFPSIYTFSADQVKWKKYAIAQVSEARRLAPGKPVYVYLWPQYHESATPVSLVHTYLPADYWLLQLETARQYADGIVLWGNASPWVDNLPWWQVMKDFMKSLNPAPSPPKGLKTR